MANLSKSVAHIDPVVFIPSFGDRISQLTKRLLLLAKGYLVKTSPQFFWRGARLLTGNYSEKEIILLPKLCDKNKISIDVGANYGAYLCPLAKHSKSCIGFEPIVEIAALLSEGFRGGNVEIFPTALSERCGIARLKIPVYHPGYSTIEPSNRFAGKIRHDKIVSTREVHMKTLDYFGFKNIGFIKIDVEGHELEVLRGAIHTLRENKPNLLIEIEERHRSGSVASVTDFLTALGYQGYFYRAGKLVSLEEFDLALQQDLRRSKDYVRNFIFRHELH